MPELALPDWLPAAALGLVLVASLARGLALRTRGVKAYGFGFKPEVQQAAERFWTIAVGLVAATALISWLAPHWEKALGRPDWSLSALQRWLAAFALIAGAVIVLAGQQAMGASWWFAGCFACPAIRSLSGCSP
jgi:hypothetical protein